MDPPPLSAAEQTALLEQFQAITGCSQTEAAAFLDAHTWDLNSALVAYFEPDAPAANVPPAPSTHTSMSRGGHDDFAVASPPISASPFPGVPLPRPVDPPAISRASPRPRAPANRFATLSDVNRASELDDDPDDNGNNDNDDDDEHARRTLYAGGGKSGISIQDPSQRSSVQDDLREILHTASRGGLPVVPDPPPPRFTGTGYTLGSESQPSQIVPSAPSAPAPAQIQRELTLWQNGVSFDDGRFFPFSDPATTDLLRMIRSGHIPRALFNAAPKDEVQLRLVKRDNEAYTPAKLPSAQTTTGASSFVGPGNRLGRHVPRSPAAHTSYVPGDVVPPAPAPPPPSAAQDPAPTFDPDEPVTTIQIRLVDGTRLTAQFNLSAPIERVYSFVGQARPTAGRAFLLQTIFPTRVLDDPAKTVEQEGLKNGTVVMRWKEV